MTLLSIEELKTRILEGGKLRIAGYGRSVSWLPHSQYELVHLQNFDHMVDYRPDDLVVRVGSGMMVDELSEIVAKNGLCLPILRNRGWLGYPGTTIGGLLGMGLPHWGVGTVRDWVIGMKFMTGSGDIVESGANVVKSVAGFDLHRMLIGSRGELGVILEIGLRLYPLKMMPIADNLPVVGDGCWISRVPKSYLFDSGVRSPNGELIWSDHELALPPTGWAIGPYGKFVCGRNGTRDRFKANLKNIFDPRGVFGSGWSQ